jgi:hypothetical protein
MPITPMPIVCVMVILSPVSFHRYLTTELFQRWLRRSWQCPRALQKTRFLFGVTQLGWRIRLRGFAFQAAD